ncbi:MAG: TldD/PmbA family protein [Acidobacteriia bacterium]|nr:TldD/PmbA family protein [Terriglobia bacterium]
MRKLIGAAVLLAFLSPVLMAQDADSSAILEAMKAELARAQQTFKGQPVQPYFLSYEITDDQVVSVTGTFGKLQTSQQSRSRQLDIDLRVGNYHLDNTHGIREEAPPAFPPVYVPVEADSAALRSVLWYWTDLKYKQAVEQLTRIKTDVQVKVEQEDKSDDFSREPAAKHLDKPLMMSVDRHAWEEKVRKYTAPFAKYGDIYAANATLLADVETRWYVNSDGSEIEVSKPFYHLYLTAQMKADDGMELPRYESFFSFDPEGLPSDAAVLKTVDQMIKDLRALRVAPIVDPYTGPAILSGRASGVFFHEVFGHRIEGHRQKAENEGQTFKKKVGEKVLPENFSVISDPTMRQLGAAGLAGYYDFDNEGVPAQRVTVVDHGVFKGFLMSRSPIEGFPHSNGHGRRQQGHFPVARQSNLIVQVDHPVSRAELKSLLIEEVKKQNKPFGLYFDDIQGGFTLTGRSIPNAFNVLPIMVYRVYPDGREELVRGVDLIGTPLTTFSKIVAGDGETATFNGICGAESGSVPVSASSPDVLVSQIEVQKKEKSNARAPLLPAPIQ